MTAATAAASKEVIRKDFSLSRLFEYGLYDQSDDEEDMLFKRNDSANEVTEHVLHPITDFKMNSLSSDLCKVRSLIWSLLLLMNVRKALHITTTTITDSSKPLFQSVFDGCVENVHFVNYVSIDEFMTSSYTGYMANSISNKISVDNQHHKQNIKYPTIYCYYRQKLDGYLEDMQHPTTNQNKYDCVFINLLEFENVDSTVAQLDNLIMYLYVHVLKKGSIVILYNTSPIDERRYESEAAADAAAIDETTNKQPESLSQYIRSIFTNYNKNDMKQLQLNSHDLYDFYSDLFEHVTLPILNKGLTIMKKK